MQRFLESWKKSVNRSCGDYNTHSLLYPVAFNPVPETKQQRTAREQEMCELRILTMERDTEVNEDEQFIENIKEVPRPKNSKEYDYMQFDRFMSKNTQRKLIDIPVMPNKYLNELYGTITGPTR